MSTHNTRRLRTFFHGRACPPRCRAQEEECSEVLDALRYPLSDSSARAAVPALWRAFRRAAATPTADARSSAPAASSWLLRGTHRSLPPSLAVSPRGWDALSWPAIALPEHIWGAFRPPAPPWIPLALRARRCGVLGSEAWQRRPALPPCFDIRCSVFDIRYPLGQADGQTHHPRGAGRRLMVQVKGSSSIGAGLFCECIHSMAGLPCRISDAR